MVESRSTSEVTVKCSCKKNDTPKWENVADNTTRLKIEGGYLYRFGQTGYVYCPTIAFVPDVPKRNK
jgi:hypothetical protein